MVDVKKYSEPDCWRVTWRQTGELSEEVMFHIQGVIEDKKLAPVRGDKSAKKLRHLKQSIVVSGLGSEGFDKDVDAVMDVYTILARHVQGLKPSEIKDLGRYSGLEFSSRVFTPKNEAPNMEWAVIDEAIDSNNFMRDVKASGVGYVHGDKNVVNFGVEVNGKEKKKTESIGPHQLHIGDVVDIAFAVIAIEGRGASNPTNGVAKLLLRSVTLLEDKHTQAWIKTKALLGSSGGRKVNQLRKRAAFDEEEVEVTRKRLKQMSLDVNEEGSSGSALFGYLRVGMRKVL
ncbi:hypothetical protein BDP27DRAFT_1430432 [Rhodocollybia butyracea]|uniref:Uncharacterized protein n=1 Tax=Rhodocollybia butyracea TaxID=206335 RepID=A0A9P5PDL1_9AGAR|nr:hypothetical protein BDP27DRAFT_1430432 [Rhodocollybia butyracea]